MWPEMLRAIQDAVSDLRRRGATVVPNHLAAWVRQSAERLGMVVQTTPVWGGRVRIEAVEVAEDVVPGR